MLTLNEEYKNLKNKNKYSIVIVQSGMFYNIYGKDAAIIAHLLGYKLFLYGNKLCLSFPSSNLEMVTGRLRIMDIAYIIIKGKYKEVYVGNPNKYIGIYKIASLVPDKKYY